MNPRPPSGRPHSGAKLGAKPGATREQVERRERFERARRDSLRPDADGSMVMYGWHTVTAALRNPERKLRKLLTTENAAR
ncbi:MAG: 23S rRNA (guanosine(2251)-2'-O)-methyltransferase RlmB, partial [Pseudolabrys sp.]